MVILRIEHKVLSYDGWKVAFDNDPIGRKKMGVKRYRIFRPVEEPTYVIIDLEFDSLEEAKVVHAALQKMWTKVEGTIMIGPKSSLLDVVETKEY